MICFEVEINGQKVCTAGVGENGSLSAILSWLKANPGEPAQRGTEQIALGVAGFTQPPGKTEWERYRWLERAMKAGDEIVIRIRERDQADPPLSKGKIDQLLRPDPAHLLEQVQKAYKTLREEVEKKTGDGYTI